MPSGLSAVGQQEFLAIIEDLRASKTLSIVDGRAIAMCVRTYELIGVTRQTIIAIESGKYAPSLILAFRIAKVFARPIEEVFQYRV